jgi:hypothetical protein
VVIAIAQMRFLIIAYRAFAAFAFAFASVALASASMAFRRSSSLVKFHLSDRFGNASVMVTYALAILIEKLHLKLPAT